MVNYTGLCRILISTRLLNPKQSTVLFIVISYHFDGHNQFKVSPTGHPA